MLNDQMELDRGGLASQAAEDRVARLATHLAKFAKAGPDAGSVEIIDAAFAKLAGTNSHVARVDAGSPAVPRSGDEKEPELKPAAGLDHFKREIFADLSAQLHALDHQRARLAELLHNIDRDAIGQ
jgi:hypothetical protein